MTGRPSASDPFDLERFVDAQRHVYDQAIEELRAGRKRSHWMWFIFPQYEGLGSSETSRYFALKSLDEARAYLAHEILGRRLRECADAVLAVEGKSAHQIFGSPDDMKLRSSATLFAQIEPAASVFEELLDRYFDGLADPQTLRLIAAEAR
jgi:uncharacterized protein (DUF1810 family)